MVTNKLYLDDRNDEYIIMCKFGSHTISGYSVTGEGPPKEKGPYNSCLLYRSRVSVSEISFTRNSAYITHRFLHVKSSLFKACKFILLRWEAFKYWVQWPSQFLCVTSSE